MVMRRALLIIAALACAVGTLATISILRDRSGQSAPGASAVQDTAAHMPVGSASPLPATAAAAATVDQPPAVSAPSPTPGKPRPPASRATDPDYAAWKAQRRAKIEAGEGTTDPAVMAQALAANAAQAAAAAAAEAAADAAAAPAAPPQPVKASPLRPIPQMRGPNPQQPHRHGATADVRSGDG